MDIESDCETDITNLALINKKEDAPEKLVAKSRVNILKLRITELYEELYNLQQNKLDTRSKLANLIEYITYDHIRFGILPLNTNKINKLLARALYSLL